ncbi:MAG: hypothetical protein HZA93_13235 [Verrucomicrobia bacterium]|nr:hypothetical protein [Verrucomicrobiota bacterium]
MNPDQSNTKPVGPVITLAGEDLTGKRSRLVVLTHDTGVGEVKLPTSNSALALFLLNDEAADTERVEVEPLIPGKTYRTTQKDAVNPGDELVLADVGTAADKGKLRKLPAVAGVYLRLGFAEKKCGAGELVEWRFAPELVHVASADTITGAADLAATKAAVLAILQAHGFVV